MMTQVTEAMRTTKHRESSASTFPQSYSYSNHPTLRGGPSGECDASLKSGLASRCRVEIEELRSHYTDTDLGRRDFGQRITIPQIHDAPGSCVENAGNGEAVGVCA